MINLVIDIGNTRTKIALFNQHDLMFSVPIDHLTLSHLKMLKEEHTQLSQAILSSVKPVDDDILQFLSENFDLFIELDHQTELPIGNLYETPETLGKDRLAAAVGANELFPDQNLLIIDAGTAITYDLVSEKNQFVGGNISPGLQMRFKALNHFTGKLPLISYSDEFQPIGRNTTDAVRAGVQNGILYEIDQTIDLFNRNYQNLQIVMTGGDSIFFDKKLNYSIFVHFNLTLIGLNRILEHNAKRNNALSVVIVLIICGLSGFAQNNNTTSPFSRYGIGDLHHYGYGRTAAMGGASLGSRHSVQINSANPASYNANDSLSFIFDFGVDGTYSKYKSSTGKMNVNDVNFRYFSLSWPVTKWLGAGMGVQPFSDMGYEVAFSEEVTGVGNVYQNYQGEGTTSKAFFGTSISPFKGLSVGANLNYIFGRLNQNTNIGFDDPALFYYSETEGTRLRNFTLTYGLQYDLKLKKDQYLTLGVTFENQTDITVRHQLYSYKGISVGTSSLSSYIDSIPESKGIIKLPSTFGIGLSYNKINKLEINADYYYAGWSKATFFGEKLYNPATDNVELVNQTRISAGVEYIPEAMSIRSYVKRVRYRAGIHHESSYLKLNNHQIKEFGVSFGAGFPFPKSKSTANFALEFGKQGTTKDNLVRNNYTKFSLYLNLYDYWFVKRKFD